MPIDDDTLHPLVAIGTAMTTFGAVSHYALVIGGLLLSYLGVYIDYRVRYWIRQQAARDAAAKDQTQPQGKP
jgi:hypothetical protein